MSEAPLWQPSQERAQASNVAGFMQAAGRRWGRRVSDYQGLWRWSVKHRDEFWASVWEQCGVIGEPGGRVLEDDGMPGARWFPDARLNFTENLLRRRDDGDALVFWGEDRLRQRLSHGELYREVARTAAALRDCGVERGDRVAAYLPNVPTTVVVMLAAASLGAVFSSASPDFGARGVLDRFGQIEPKLLFACDGYYYNGKEIDCLPKVAEIVAGLPALLRTVIVPYAGSRSTPPAGALRFEEFLAPHAAEGEITFERLPFDHPLVIVYSSGTTGVPKCIVHGAGGTLLQHLKEHRLHCDLRPDDRLFYYTTSGWVMWNWLVSALASRATVLLYDGSPFAAGGELLFDYADAEAMTHFGTSAKYLDALAKSGAEPAASHRLAALRVMLSTGSPLSPEGFDYVYSAVKRDVQLASISGGTDIISCFVLGNPVGAVWRGEIQCRGLGMAVDVLDAGGRSVRGERGDLVCTRAFPSMPIGFWNDPGGAKYRAAYFERFPGVWCHGDFAEITEHGGVIIHGRSDAVLNPGGVRIGTAEIYRQVEKVPEVLESVVIGQRWEGDLRLVLFVRLRKGIELDAALAERIRRELRDNATPRHVPAKILSVPDLPRTHSGKIVELAVRAVVHGEPVANVEALANPEVLEQFRNRPELSMA